MSDIRILQDRALGKREKDRFGYSDIADNLIGLVKGIEPPFTIGLYGPWGVGKSTICKIVQGELENSEGFRVFYFDTWKYERDSFRRQFLIELDERLFEGKLKYRGTLNQSLTLPQALPFKEAFRRNFNSTVSVIANKFLLFALLLVVSAGILFSLNYFFSFLNGPYADITKVLINAVFNISVVIYFIQFIFESIKTIEGQVEVPKTDSAEGFEFYYKEALRKLGNGEKLIVIIDNIDRLDYQRAIDMLSDIKTFLASDSVEDVPNKSIFLIPCDNEAISKQLRKSYYDDLDTEEYLRKFFNLSFKIPKLLDLELDDYVEEKLKETNVPEFIENHSLSFVISRAFRNNPREIIQFTNSLILTYLLAKKRNLENIISKSKVPFLAKILVIRVRWPEIYDALENEIVRSASNVSEIVSGLSEKKLSGFDKCKEFLRATEGIQDEEGEDIFFAIKESNEQKTVPEWKAFISAAEDRRDADLQTAYDSVLKNDKARALVSLMGDYARKNKTKDVKLANVFVSTAKLINKNNLISFVPFLQSIITYLSNDQLTNRRSEIDFEFLFNESFDKLDSHLKQDIKNKFISILSTASRTQKSDWASIASDLKLWKVVSKNSGDFNSSKTKLIEVKRDFIKNPQSTLAGFPFQPSDKDVVRELVSAMYLDFPLSRALYEGIYSLSFILLQHASLQTKQDREYILESLIKFFDAVGNPPKAESHELTTLKQLTSQLIAIPHGADFETSSLIVEVLHRINVPENPQRQEILNRTAEYIRTITKPEDKYEERIIKALGEDKIVELCSDQSIKDALSKRTGAFPELYITLSMPPDFFGPAELQQIFQGLISTNAVGLTSLVKHLKYKLPENIKEPVALLMIRSINFSDPDLLKDWLKTIEKIGIPGGAHINELINALRTTYAVDQAHKKVVEDFVKRNESVIGSAQAQEFLPKTKEE